MAVYTTIDNPELFMQVKLFAGTGTGGSTTAVTLDGSEDMAPDLVWVNHRNAAGNWKGIADTVRGVQKGLHSNTNAAEATSAEYLTAFGSDGFTVGENGSWGANSVNYVAYANTIKMLINIPKADISKKIIEGQNYIRDYHTPEIIGKRWIDLENKVGRTGF